MVQERAVTYSGTLTEVVYDLSSNGAIFSDLE